MRSTRRWLGGFLIAATVATTAAPVAASPEPSAAPVTPAVAATPPSDDYEQGGHDTGNLDAQGHDHGHDHGTVGTRALPTEPSFGFTIDDLSPYLKQTTCDPVAKRGALRLRSLLLGANPGTGDLGIVRACHIGGTSEHKEGRAFDWAVDATNPRQRMIADGVLAWMLATDDHGHRYSVARRLGIMYIIWNRRIWSSERSQEGWRVYEGPNPHTDHVHFSLSPEGAAATTSWWAPRTTFGPVAGPSLGTRHDFDGDGFDDLFFYGPGAASDYIHWGRSRSEGPLSVPVTVNGAYWPVSGDLDGDGADDVIWYAPGPGADYLWRGTPGARSFTSTSVTANGSYRPFVGDFDGNGLDDVFWYGPGPLPDYLWWSIDTGATYSYHSVPMTVNGVYDPIVGDFDGDGSDDIAWYGRSSLVDSLWISRGAQRSFAHRTLRFDGIARPFAGDFDGDGRDDIFWYVPGGGAGGVQWGSASGPGGVTSFRIQGDYVPLVGDIDGDGADDIGWYGLGTADDHRWMGTHGSRRFQEVSEEINGIYRVF